MRYHLGLIGYPLAHSLSPQIHNAAFRSCGLEGDYSLFPIAPDDMLALKDLLTSVRTGRIHGLNVTIPHKQNVIQFLDEFTPMAGAIGAVNTVYLRDSKLLGHNTDVFGFIADLNHFLEDSSLVAHHSALVLGSGGAARAVVYALLTNGWDVTLAARRIEQAQQLASSFTNYNLRITSTLLSKIDSSNIALIVNTTPVGMSPNVDESPWPENIPFPPRAVVYDLIYNPGKTKLVRDAEAQGLPATTGLGMLVTQAALAFELWTGCLAPRETMFASVNQHLVSNR